MSQNDLVIANQSAPNFRSDLNDALQALASLSAGSTAPSTTYANMLWYDTGNNTLKMRSEADDAWIDIGVLNQSTNTFEVANVEELSKAEVEDDADTTFGLVSGERLAESFAANEQQIGVNQTPQDVLSSRAFDGTAYQNTTGKPIVVSFNDSNRSNSALEVSSDGSTWVVASSKDGAARSTHTAVVPDGWYYRHNDTTADGSNEHWLEVR